jgi:hypothetical protein
VVTHLTVGGATNVHDVHQHIGIAEVVQKRIATAPPLVRTRHQARHILQRNSSMPPRHIRWVASSLRRIRCGGVLAPFFLVQKPRT